MMSHPVDTAQSVGGDEKDSGLSLLSAGETDSAVYLLRVLEFLRIGEAARFCILNKEAFAIGRSPAVWKEKATLDEIRIPDFKWEGFGGLGEFGICGKMKKLKDAEKLYRGRQHGEAVKILEPLSKEFPHNPTVLVMLADAEFAQKEANRACELYLQALEEAPDHIPALNGLAILGTKTDQSPLWQACRRWEDEEEGRRNQAEVAQTSERELGHKAKCLLEDMEVALLLAVAAEGADTAYPLANLACRFIDLAPLPIAARAPMPPRSWASPRSTIEAGARMIAVESVRSRVLKGLRWMVLCEEWAEIRRENFVGGVSVEFVRAVLERPLPGWACASRVDEKDESKQPQTGTNGEANSTLPSPSPSSSSSTASASASSSSHPPRQEKDISTAAAPLLQTFMGRPLPQRVHREASRMWALAEALALRAVTQNPHLLHVRTALGYLYEKLGCFAESTRTFLRQLEVHPNDTTARAILIHLVIRQLPQIYELMDDVPGLRAFMENTGMEGQQEAISLFLAETAQIASTRRSQGAAEGASSSPSHLFEFPLEDFPGGLRSAGWFHFDDRRSDRQPEGFGGGSGETGEGPDRGSGRPSLRPATPERRAIARLYFDGGGAERGGSVASQEPVQPDLNHMLENDNEEDEEEEEVIELDRGQEEEREAERREDMQPPEVGPGSLSGGGGDGSLGVSQRDRGDDRRSDASSSSDPRDAAENEQLDAMLEDILAGTRERYRRSQGR